MKTYIVSFYQQEVSEDELIAFLENKHEVLNLTRSLPNTVLIASDRNASHLASIIDKKFPKGYFIVAEYIPYNSDGSLPVEMWDFLNKPKARRVGKSGSKRGVAKAKPASKRR